MRFISHDDRKSVAAALRPIYTAATAEAAAQELDALEGSNWGKKYPATVRVWRDAWERFIPFLEFPPAVRKIIYTTDEIVKIVPGVAECRSPGDRLVAPIAGFLHRRPSPPERRRGQDAAPHWTNDLDRAEHRHILKAGGTPPRGGSDHQTGARVPVGLVACQCATKTW